MSTRTRKTNPFHLVAVVFSATFAGTMITIGIGLGGYWLSIAPSEFAAWLSNYFKFLVPTVALTLPPALVASVVAWRTASVPALRRQWRRVVFALVGIVAITMAFHLPANVRIWSGEMAEAELGTLLRWWLGLHAARIALAIAAAVLGFVASQHQPPQNDGLESKAKEQTS